MRFGERELSQPCGKLKIVPQIMSRQVNYSAVFSDFISLDYSLTKNGDTSTTTQETLMEFRAVEQAVY